MESSQLIELNESIGCIAILCGASNFPLLSFIIHMMAAIANGNSIIIVPDEASPVPALDLYEVENHFFLKIAKIQNYIIIKVFETSDMPGIVNILSGNKQHLAKYLCEHQQVQSIWYMSDVTNERSSLNDNDLSAIRFIRYTSNFSLKNIWIINLNDLFNSNEELETVLDKYSSELNSHSIQYKYVHIPFGVIFAN